MTTMTEQDEARLSDRLHTIGDAVEQCHGEGRADLLAPRRSHRYTLTVTVAAAAVLVLVAVAVLVTRSDGGETNQVADGSGVLDGVALGPIGTFALVDTPRGIVAVVADHDGRPAIYVPDADGRYTWIAQKETRVPADPTVTVTELRAWRDGDSIRILQRLRRDCPDDDAPNSHGLEAFMAGRCSPESLFLTTYQMGSRAPWGGGGSEDQSSPWKILAVGGKRVVGLGSMGGAGSQLILMGVSGGSGHPSDLVEGTKACASNGTFLFAEPGRHLRVTVLDVWKPSDGSPLQPPVSKEVPFTGSERIDEPGTSVSVVGCVADGMVVAVSGPDGSDGVSRRLRVLSVSDGEDAISVIGLPRSPLEGSGSRYVVDETGSTVVDRRPDGKAAVLLGDRWRVLPDPVPDKARIAAGSTGVFVLEPDDNGYTLRRAR